MRSDDITSRRKLTRELGIADEHSIDIGGGAMSSRGARYWSSGSIPLIGPELLGDIIATAGDIAIVISDVGQILSVLVNPTHPSFGNLDHWEGRDIRDFLTLESVPKLEREMAALSADSTGARFMELNHFDDGDWEFPVRYTLHEIGPDGAILLLGRDMRPIAEMQQQLVQAQLQLERDYEEQREFNTRYRVLMESVREAVVFVSVETGRILDANSAAASLLGVAASDLAGTAFDSVFDGRRKAELIDALSTAAISETKRFVKAVGSKSKTRLNIVPSVFRAAGDRMLICRLENSEDSESNADELTDNLSGLYQEGVDAILFTDRDGIIQSANESFLNLVDVAHLTLVKGKPLGDFLSRGSVDTKVLIENAVRSGNMRLYATRIVSAFGGQTPVEISATYLNDRAHPALVYVMRDVSRVEAVRRPGGSVGDDGVRNVMELVGSATLKDIVSETTDVVEKMCIETAVELTRNNRVAAAEMLGLSRQSLYVKLRKYGLLNRGPGRE